MKNNKVLRVFLSAAALTLGMSAHAEETKLEQAETVANKTSDSIKRSYRGAKDKTCEMINGKLECVAKKIKNKAKNMSDKIETKATEEKNKVD